MGGRGAHARCREPRRSLAQAVHVAINAEFMCKRRPPVFSHEIDVAIGSVQFIRSAVVVIKATAGVVPALVKPRYYYQTRQSCHDKRWAAPNKFATWGTAWRAVGPQNNTDHGPAGPVIRGHYQRWYW